MSDTYPCKVCGYHISLGEDEKAIVLSVIKKLVSWM